MIIILFDLHKTVFRKRVLQLFNLLPVTVIGSPHKMGEKTLMQFLGLRKSILQNSSFQALTLTSFYGIHNGL